MVVWVDQMFTTIPSKKWRYKTACHLFGTDLAELRPIALSIGLKPQWEQIAANGVIHFDLTASKRVLAIRKGAVSLKDGKEVVEAMKLACKADF